MHDARHEARCAHGIRSHLPGRSHDHETRMLRREHRQRQGRPLLHARTRAARDRETLHVRAVGAGQARRPADSGDRVDDQADHEAMDSSNWATSSAGTSPKYFRRYARQVTAQSAGSSNES